MNRHITRSVAEALMVPVGFAFAVAFFFGVIPWLAFREWRKDGLSR